MNFFKKKKKEKKLNIIDTIVNIFFISQEEYDKKYPKKKVEVSKKSVTKFEFVFVGILLLLFGIVIGCLVTLCTDSVLGSKVDNNVIEFLKVYNDIKENYYEDVDGKELIDAGISGMFNSLDDENSYFMDEDTTQSFNTTIDGKYVGIGISIQYQDSITKVVSIFDNSPASEAGIKVDDVIVKVNGKDVTSSTSEEIISMIGKKLGSKVDITMRRGEEEIDFSLTLSEIEIPSVYSEIIEKNDKKVARLYLDNFASNTYSQFKKELNSLEEKGFDSLIIDVRSNTGGHLSQVYKILDLFFKKDTVLFKIQSKKKITDYKAKTDTYTSYPVVILVNGGSASASEVLASCFKDNYSNATILGTTTYGKGTVQESTNLSSGTSYKFTTEKWLTSKGKWLHKKGLKPDVVVEYDSESEEDNQLNEAVNILTK